MYTIIKQMSHQFGNTIKDEQVRHEYSQKSEAIGRAEGELPFPLNGKLYLPCLSRMMIQSGARDERADSRLTIMEELCGAEEYSSLNFIKEPLCLFVIIHK